MEKNCICNKNIHIMPSRTALSIDFRAKSICIEVKKLRKNFTEIIPIRYCPFCGREL